MSISKKYLIKRSKEYINTLKDLINMNVFSEEEALIIKKELKRFLVFLGLSNEEVKDILGE